MCEIFLPECFGGWLFTGDAFFDFRKADSGHLAHKHRRLWKGILLRFHGHRKLWRGECLPPERGDPASSVVGTVPELDLSSDFGHCVCYCQQFNTKFQSRFPLLLQSPTASFGVKVLVRKKLDFKYCFAVFCCFFYYQHA